MGIRLCHLAEASLTNAKHQQGQDSTMVEQQNLADLPNEVLTEVLSNITDQGHLAKIASVSKQFKDLVDLQLYRHIRLDIPSPTKELHSTRPNNNYSLVRFDRLMNALSARQNLARRVHALSLRVHSGLWYKGIAAGSRLLDLLPELRTLSLSPPPLRLSVSRMNSTITSLRLDFSRVTDHYDEAGDRRRMVPMDIIARHLSLPKVRKLQVERTSLRPDFDGMHHLPAGDSSVDDLRLLECWEQKSDRVVAAFLCSIKCLKRFVFEVSSQPHNTLQFHADAGSFERALTRHQATIEELAIATSQGSATTRWMLGPFTQWSSLKFLAIPDYMIPGVFRGVPGPQKLHEILPPLLEELQIEYLWPRIRQNIRDTARAEDMTGMQHLAENKEFCCPWLNRVIWWHQEDYIPKFSKDIMDDNLPALMEIFLAFEQVGVKFEWVTEAAFKNTPFGKRLCEWQE